MRGTSSWWSIFRGTRKEAYWPRRGASAGWNASAATQASTGREPRPGGSARARVGRGLDGRLQRDRHRRELSLGVPGEGCVESERADDLPVGELELDRVDAGELLRRGRRLEYPALDELALPVEHELVGVSAVAQGAVVVFDVEEPRDERAEMGREPHEELRVVAIRPSTPGLIERVGERRVRRAERRHERGIEGFEATNAIQVGVPEAGDAEPEIPCARLLACALARAGAPSGHAAAPRLLLEGCVARWWPVRAGADVRQGGECMPSTALAAVDFSGLLPSHGTARGADCQG